MFWKNYLQKSLIERMERKKENNKMGYTYYKVYLILDDSGTKELVATIVEHWLGAFVQNMFVNSCNNKLYIEEAINQ